VLIIISYPPIFFYILGKKLFINLELYVQRLVQNYLLLARKIYNLIMKRAEFNEATKKGVKPQSILESSAKKVMQGYVKSKQAKYLLKRLQFKVCRGRQVLITEQSIT
jgi:hypothetical protein